MFNEAWMIVPLWILGVLGLLFAYIGGSALLCKAFQWTAK